MLLDSYERRARLTPGLLAVVPIALTVIVLGLRENPVVATCAGLLSAVGGPFVLANIVRDRGMALQAKIFRSWGGPPTRRFLQTYNTEHSAAERTAWRRDVESASGTTLPTADDERLNADHAAGTYDAAISRVRTKTRDKKQFGLVFEENRNYGYWRNLRAMRAFGIVIATLCLLVVGTAASIAARSDLLADTSRSTFVLGALLDIGALAFWLIVPSEAAVKRASERYAERLLESAAAIH
jgi:hypothetical protein